MKEQTVNRHIDVEVETKAIWKEKKWQNVENSYFSIVVNLYHNRSRGKLFELSFCVKLQNLFKINKKIFTSTTSKLE